jgi:hypothetical protein
MIHEQHVIAYCIMQNMNEKIEIIEFGIIDE